MKSIKVFLTDLSVAEEFVHTMRQFEGEYDLVYGSYTVDAKSTLGVFALGIGKELDLVFVNPRDDESDVVNAIGRFMKAA